MVTEIQKRKIKQRMRAIKDLTDANAPDKEVNKAVKELTDYLQQEGIINPFSDDD
jgi:hypothetical protein